MEIKDNWSKVTIGEYQRIIDLYEMKEGGQFDDLDLNIELYALLSGMTVNEVESLPYVNMDKVFEKLQFINTVIPTGEVKRWYKLGDKRFSPVGTAKMISEASARDMKAIQYIDYIGFCNRMEQNEKIRHIHTEMALFLIPEKEYYGMEGFSIYENSEIIKNHMLITDALAVSAFFLSQYNSLITALATSLERGIKKNLKKMTPEQWKQLKSEEKKLKHLRSQTLSCQPMGGATILGRLLKKTT